MVDRCGKADNTKVISEDDYKKASEIIRQFKTQVENERREEFRKRLSEFDKTYWYYKGSLEQIYFSAIADEHAYIITRFIVKTNGIIEIKCDHKLKEDLEYYIKEMGEFAPDEWDFEYGKNKSIFKEMTHPQFLWEVSNILTKLKISENEQIKIITR